MTYYLTIETILTGTKEVKLFDSLQAAADWAKGYNHKVESITISSKAA
jgi:hypothetical protein